MSKVLRRYIDEIPANGGRLHISAAHRADTLVEMTDQLFRDQPISVVEEEEAETAPDDHIVAIREGEVVATSPLDRFAETILLVNSDLYTTTTRQIEELDLPDVLEALEDTEFVLDGYPASNTEKVLFIAISRLIEQMAFDSGDGILRSGFQKLSRIRDERGTADVYRRLGDSAVAVHLYGVPDWIPAADLGAVIHGGYSSIFRDFWFVVFAPADRSTDTGMALVSEEIDENRWRGFWTRDTDLISAIDDDIASNL
ncbi:putative sensor protein, containd DICT domain [Halanaeroarchaeum sp. HSR-CO]|uniref:hypothetical protein n=1 Tax=Halanaeroarchaeum sp. HSR-CO TaxID=2866382 RepID=UPI00217E12FA|nr:hypothetical protein [Halanaeroarchaeum sp. HSR-CO]UWG48054.1 putative sensor protein, containd DICT domain [Halanaeroarchaeum sp. HSR-CO]